MFWSANRATVPAGVALTPAHQRVVDAERLFVGEEEESFFH
jgi:hypothetical protein